MQDRNKGEEDGIKSLHPEISKMMLCSGEEFVDWGTIMREREKKRTIIMK